jgi:pimeloyl-ACP methyl ester carboxylesterase
MGGRFYMTFVCRAHACQLSHILNHPPRPNTNLPFETIKQPILINKPQKQHEVAAFASDPANDAYYRAMIAEWRTAGIYDEMLLCAEAGGGGGGYGGAAASSNNSNSNSSGKGSSSGGGGSKGVLRERFSYLTDVKAAVRVYAAANDVLVPAAVAQGWAAALPAGAVELRVIEGATHDGIVHTHKGEVLEVLARDLRGGRRG